MASENPRPVKVRPESFEPLNEHAGGREHRPHNTLRWLLLGTTLLFVLVMGFLFTASTMEIRVDSESPADIDVGGLDLRFGERFLVLPGQHSLLIQAAGYHTLETGIDVTGEAGQVFEFQLQPLPGEVTITTRPPGATAKIDGRTVGQTPVSLASVEAGSYTLTLDAPRYLPVSRELEVIGRHQSQYVEVNLEPAWADVRIDSDLPGAAVLVDGEPRGTTPAVIEVLRGDREISLEKAGFATWRRNLEIQPARHRDLGTITLVPAQGIVSLRSNPSGANVTLDGEFQGQTPLELAVEPGRSHRMAVFKPGYKRHNETIEMRAGATAERDIALQPRLGEVAFEIEPAQATLKINGEVIGEGPRNVALPALEHRVEVSLEGYAPQRLRITPREGLEQRVEVKLKTEREARLAQLPQRITTSADQTLLRFIPGDPLTGDFVMGASRRDPGRRANEVLRPVSLTRIFYLQTREVTNGQFRRFQQDHNSGQVKGNSLNRDSQPVVGISWQQAARFCNWLSRQENLPPFYKESKGIIIGHNPDTIGYRLPTEAEWTWAARVQGEGLKTFPWGETFPPTEAVENYAGEASAYITGSFIDGYKDGHIVTADVGSLAANDKGLYDLGGNVAEWVNDIYTIPEADGETVKDPTGEQKGDHYVIRGASWARSRLSELRLSYRDYGISGNDETGFRIARYAE